MRRLIAIAVLGFILAAGWSTAQASPLAPSRTLLETDNAGLTQVHYRRRYRYYGHYPRYYRHYGYYGYRPYYRPRYYYPGVHFYFGPRFRHW